MSAVSSARKQPIPSSVLAERFALKPHLVKLSAKLTAYRDNFTKLIEKYNKFEQFDFNSSHTLERALDRNKLFRTYLKLLTRLTREPTLHELTDDFNKVCKAQYSPWTVRRCIREINRESPRNMPSLILTKETQSQIYLRDTANCYLTFVERGEQPSYRDMMLSLKKLRKDSNPSWYSVKKAMRSLRDRGFDVHLKHGELSFELVRDMYTTLKNRHRVAPSISLIAVTIYQRYGIETNNKALAKMLAKVRRTLAPKTKENWNASRTRKSYDFELISAYNIVKRGLLKKGVRRNPSTSEVHSQLVSSKGKKAPSKGTVTACFTKLNKDRIETGKPPYKLSRIVFQHHDHIEQAAHLLKEGQKRPPTQREIALYLAETLNINYSEELIGKAIRSINRSRGKSHKIIFTPRPPSNLTDHEILLTNADLSNIYGKRVPKRALYEAILANNPDRHISWDGFSYRLTSLNKKGLGIKVKGSPNKPVVRAKKLTPEEIEKIKDMHREKLAKRITDFAINKRYPGKIPAHIQKLQSFFHSCVSVTLKAHDDVPGYGVREVRELLDLHSSKLSWAQKEELED